MENNKCSNQEGMSFGADGHQLPWKVLEIYYPVFRLPFLQTPIISRCSCSSFFGLNGMNLTYSFLSHSLPAWWVFQDLSFLLLTRELSCLLSGLLQIANFAPYVLGLVVKYKEETLIYLFMLTFLRLIVSPLDPAPGAVFFPLSPWL